MDFLNMTNAEPVELADMLAAREHRQNLQQNLLAAYRLPLISFTLNIAGPVKVFPLAVKTYEEGLRLIKESCKIKGWPIVNLTEIKEKTGYEAFFSIDMEPDVIKELVLLLENQSVLGRLFDIDIIRTNGEKVSRADFHMPLRKCLLCDHDVFVCSRSRAHDTAALFQKTCEIMRQYFQ